MRGDRSPAALPYIAHADAAGVPNVMADGAPLPSTVLTLSHWPGTPTPRELWADLSAEIAFRYLRSRRPDPRAEGATADHFDQDGIVTLFALTDPPEALAREDRLVAVARAGDFQEATDRDAARVSMAIAAFADPGRTPLPEAFASSRNPSLSGVLHSEVLGELPDMCDHPDHYRHLWAEEDVFLDDTLRSIASGAVTIEEDPELDLAVVTASRAVQRRASEFSRSVSVPVHPVAIHNATAMTRVLTLGQGDYELRFRYETWVRLATRRPRLRVDAAPLAARLTEREPSGAAWSFTGAPAIIARMRCETSGLTPEVVRSEVTSFLAGAAGAEPAWDPYRS